LRFEKLISWVGNKLVFDFSVINSKNLGNLNINFFRNLIGREVYAENLKRNEKKKIGKISDIIGRIDSPKVVVTLLDTSFNQKNLLRKFTYVVCSD